jgi:gluconolactonase
VGESPTYNLLVPTTLTQKIPYFHEAPVYIPAHDELWLTSSLLKPKSSAALPTICISRIKLKRDPPSGITISDGPSHITSLDWTRMWPPKPLDMPNGAINYGPYLDGILFAAQGSLKPGSSGIFHLPRASGAASGGANGQPIPLVRHFHGREFNSPNDVIVSKKDGSIWFTDPSYGHEQEFRPPPQLPNQVYRFCPRTGGIRVVADGLVKPNGIAFNPGETVCYITDTGVISGDGKKDLTRPATIYAYDVVHRSGEPFLENRRVFAYACDGIPDGIKCDVHGNVYSGCGDGVEVWNAGGTLLGKIRVPGGVANFCFGWNGEIFMAGEQNLWRVQLDRSTKGDLLDGETKPETGSIVPGLL